MDKLLLNKNKVAFTMIELLVVISIIAILATILFSVIGTMETTAKKNKTKALMMKISMALEDYKEENGSYPADANPLTTTELPIKYLNPVKFPTNLTTDTNNPGYIKPSGNIVDVWDTTFKYLKSSTKANFANTYELCSLGADKTVNTTDDIYCRGGEFGK